MRLLLARGVRPVLLGGPDEVALGAELAALVPGALNLTGLTTIPEACRHPGQRPGATWPSIRASPTWPPPPGGPR